MEGLERALRAEEPRLHARLRDMRPGRLTAWQVVLGLVSGVGLGLANVRCLPESPRRGIIFR
ncbi:hypothetical protein [Mycobacterium sp.]|uniref:hypothetical protein n=1 Tax=Mycobacterium sp. TaxID=1785 RepID=UPI003C733EDC